MGTVCGAKNKATVNIKDEMRERSMILHQPSAAAKPPKFRHRGGLLHFIRALELRTIMVDTSAWSTQASSPRKMWFCGALQHHIIIYSKPPTWKASIQNVGRLQHKSKNGGSNMQVRVAPQELILLGPTQRSSRPRLF